MATSPTQRSPKWPKWPLQFVWWGWAWACKPPRGVSFKWIRGSPGYVYKWTLAIGPMEIRRWNRRRWDNA